MSDASAILARIDELEGLAHVPGNWKCDACGFVLVHVVLDFRAGECRAGEDSHKCPNGCGLMRRLTERERADENYAGCERLADERNALKARLARCKCGCADE